MACSLIAQAQDQSGVGYTPIMQAVNEDYAPGIELLLQNRAEVLIPTSQPFYPCTDSMA